MLWQNCLQLSQRHYCFYWLGWTKKNIKALLVVFIIGLTPTLASCLLSSSMQAQAVQIPLAPQLKSAKVISVEGVRGVFIDERDARTLSLFFFELEQARNK